MAVVATACGSEASLPPRKRRRGERVGAPATGCRAGREVDGEARGDKNAGGDGDGRSTAKAAGLEGIDSRGEEEEALCCVALVGLDSLLTRQKSSNQGRSVQHIAMAHQGVVRHCYTKMHTSLAYQWRTFARCAIAI